MWGSFWRIISLKAAFITVSLLATYLKADDEVQKLPFCNPDIIEGGAASNDLLIVSTLDGRVSAFSTNSGIKAWDIETKPLFSSNLHHVELTAGGKWVRLVPSLRGTLYSLSGETIEPLPFNAEQLLSASFKYSEDLVIAGARESVWMGVDAATGSVIYQCGSAGCNSEEQTARDGRDVLVLRRNSNVVRALEPRTGNEKWNFSVAEHQLAFSSTRECGGATSNGPPQSDYSVTVALPDGVVSVRNADGTQALLWQHKVTVIGQNGVCKVKTKLDAPVAGLWRLRAGSLQNIDILWAAAKALTVDTFVQVTPPSLYIGLHDQQLYVHEGILHVQKSETAVATKPIPWKLIHSRPLIAGPTTVQEVQNYEPNSLSLIALYGNSGQTGNHGFFLYSEAKCDQAVQTTEDDEHDRVDILMPDDIDGDTDHHHVHVHVYSLWFWWKEVLLIAISSALLMNLIFWPRFFVPRLRPPTPLPVNQDVIVVERHYERPISHSIEYSGRYENDFTPLRCLGRGGFGVVFEARNNIDHCSYAVKRITLPRRESRRERVLREVRALAKLEHEHIVRYFNAWLEEPPPLWQEQRDAVWMRELDGVSVAMHDDYTSPKGHDTHPTSVYATKSLTNPDNVMLNLQKDQWEKSIDACIDAMEYDKKMGEPARRNRSMSCNESFSILFDDNAAKNTSETKDSAGHTQEHTSAGHTQGVSKNLAAGDNDDSFIVFAHTHDENHNSKENGGNMQVERLKYDYSKTESEPNRKKKKGHTRHWSLDLCVKSLSDEPATSRGKMYLYIQMQLCRRDSLHDWLRQHRTYQARADKVKCLFSQIVSAVEYVHLAGLIHRDLKPSNIFFAPDGRVKVGDFGLVTTMTENSQDSEEGPAEEFHLGTRHTYRVGTRLYMSPEQLRGHPYSYKVDIYSLGLILFELLQPFNTESERINCLLHLREGRYPNTFKENYSSEMEVLKMMLSDDPSLRPTAAGVRARAPLYQETDNRWHFTLPHSNA